MARVTLTPDRATKMRDIPLVHVITKARTIPSRAFLLSTIPVTEGWGENRKLVIRFRVEISGMPVELGVGVVFIRFLLGWSYSPTVGLDPSICAEGLSVTMMGFCPSA